ncbi:MAG: 3D domain-containing protein [Deltaproteobacteria bacterium]|nr:3D domain-containing protein [Candidatus Zymogenaceae bacterium]
MERPEIVEILIQSLHCPPADEQLVAYAFLREIVTRRNEPLARRSRVLLHLSRYHARRIAIHAIDSAKTLDSAIRHFPRKARGLALWARNTVLNGYRLSHRVLLFTLIVAANGYFCMRDGLAACTAAAIASIVQGRTMIIDTVAGVLAFFADVRRRSYGAVAAAFTKILDTIKTACALALATLAGAYTASRISAHAAYAGAIRTVVHSYVQTRDAVRLCTLWTAFRIALILAAARARYIGTRDTLLLFIALIVERITRSYRFVRMVCAEIKRHATRQVLPEGTTPFIVAGLVCLVLFVFGINSYFVISDSNKKGIFIDLSRYEWGDEALASILIGEGYDIYLNEKITEKRIKDLLSSGQYYERIIRVTGYYSPLPDQKKYATGTYRGDIILNGRGIMGSDTTPVYIGMAAGPPHMEFGTNVIIEDLGKFDLPKIYTVHDRGGAINGNRLDIWVGKGEEAMEKAYKITGYYKVIVVGDK